MIRFGCAVLLLAVLAMLGVVMVFWVITGDLVTR